MEPDKDYNLTVGLRIREIREVLNMSREEFSDKCNISSSFLTAVESEKKLSLQKHYIKSVPLLIFLLIISLEVIKRALNWI